MLLSISLLLIIFTVGYICEKRGGDDEEYDSEDD